MKLQYKLGIMALSLIAFSSCVEDEPYEDNIEVEKPTNICNWEVSSIMCKAGKKFAFKGVYSSEKEYTFSHSEVWYNVYRIDEAYATAKLAGPSLSYTRFYSNEALVQKQLTFKFDHSLAVWNGEAFEIIDSVPVSTTLAPVNWNTPNVWDENKYSTYFPRSFAEEFENVVDSLIVTDTYYNALRYLYINRNFDTKKFDELTGLNTTEEIQNNISYDANDENSLVTIKSTLWHDYDNPMSYRADIVAFYYITIDDAGRKTYTIVPTDEVICVDYYYVLSDNHDIRVYEVYESAPWVFSRYDDDLGRVVSTVRKEYISAFSEALVEPITFNEWIYSNSDKRHIISFKRNYVLDASFRVFELDGNVNVADNHYSIQIN